MIFNQQEQRDIFETLYASEDDDQGDDEMLELVNKYQSVDPKLSQQLVALRILRGLSKYGVNNSNFQNGRLILNIGFNPDLLIQNNDTKEYMVMITNRLQHGYDTSHNINISLDISKLKIKSKQNTNSIFIETALSDPFDIKFANRSILFRYLGLQLENLLDKTYILNTLTSYQEHLKGSGNSYNRIF